MNTDGIQNFKELEPNRLVDALIITIEDQLPGFKDSDEFVDILAYKKNEDQHSTALCVYMNNRCADFCFSRENNQKGSRTVDIGVYKGSILFFTIEAKLLPTPKGSNRNEHEYVYGKGGGIQRFKNNNHGLDNRDNLLNKNGLIAYLKENDFQYWYQKINQWIVDANWAESEKLKKNYFNSIAKLQSRHIRKGNSEVILYHFWIYSTE